MLLACFGSERFTLFELRNALDIAKAMIKLMNSYYASPLYKMLLSHSIILLREERCLKQSPSLARALGGQR